MSLGVFWRISRISFLPSHLQNAKPCIASLPVFSGRALHHWLARPQGEMVHSWRSRALALAQLLLVVWLVGCKILAFTTVVGWLVAGDWHSPQLLIGWLVGWLQGTGTHHSCWLAGCRGLALTTVVGWLVGWVQGTGTHHTCGWLAAGGWH